jgi:hypothetical protein
MSPQATTPGAVLIASPQQYALPSCASAHTWSNPMEAVIETALGRPVTLAGTQLQGPEE